MGASLLALGTLYAMQPSAAAPPTTVNVPDPLAARRQAAPAVEPDRSHAEAVPGSFDEAAYAAGDGARALAQYEDAVERNPDDSEARNSVGHMLVRLRRVEDALPHFERAIVLDPERPAYRINLAHALGLLQRWDESIAAYRHAQQLLPGDYLTTFNLGLTLHNKGDEAAAVEEYTKAIALEPDDAPCRMALASSYEALDRRQDAAVAYTEYLRLSPAATDAEEVRARIARLTGAPPQDRTAPAGM